MQGPGDRPQHTGGMGHRERQQGRADDVVLFGAFLVAGVLAGSPFSSLASLDALPQLACGATIYAGAIVMAVLPGVVPVGRLQRVLSLASIGLVFYPLFLGSLCIAIALNQLTGSRVNAFGVGLLGLLLWAIVYFVIFLLFARRTTARR